MSPRKEATRRIIASVFVAVLFLSVLAAAEAISQETPDPNKVTVVWSLDAELQIPAADVPDIGNSAEAASPVLPGLVERLRLKGITATAEMMRMDGQNVNCRLKANGRTTIEEFRSILYSTVRPEFNLLGGETLIDISTDAAGPSDLNLLIESNPSTGYRWDVTGGTYTDAAPNDYIIHTHSTGAPERQILHLRLISGTTPGVDLLYRRPWQDTVPKCHISLALSSLPEVLDLSDPTIRGTDLTPSNAPAENDAIFPKIDKSSLPASWDWRNVGIVTPVRDQGNCGSCWAFGTVGVMESALWKAGVANQDLSEQYLVSCNNSGWDCNGGLTAHMYHFNALGKNQTGIGAVLESEKPYTASNGSCPGPYSHPFLLTGWQFITGSEWTVATPDQIKSAIYTYGPVTCGVCVRGAFENYFNGIFSTNETCSGGTNHQVVLVGWDDNGGNGYWILRNSWNIDWGESGYMRISWGTSRVGEGTSWVTTASGCVSPNIFGQPQSQTIAAGHQATLTVVATGTDLHYLWYQGAASDTSVPVGSDTNSLAVTPAITSSYWVRIINGCGVADSNAATVTIGGGGSDGPIIESISSKTSSPGQKASIYGTGFSATVKQNSVSFGDRIAIINRASTTKLTINIPRRCRRGNTYGVTVVVKGTASNTVDFTVR